MARTTKKGLASDLFGISEERFDEIDKIFKKFRNKKRLGWTKTYENAKEAAKIETPEECEAIAYIFGREYERNLDPFSSLFPF